MATHSPYGGVDEDTTTDRFAEAVLRDGFAVIRGPELAPALPAYGLAGFHRAYDDLPQDDQMTIEIAYRFRRYGRLRVDLTGPEPVHEPLPHVAFQQDSIPLWKGRRRMFAPIEPATLLDPFLLALVDFDVRLAQAVSPVRSWTVGLHLIRIVARDGSAGMPTPEGRHRDGHLFVGMHMLARVDCVGGRSTVHPESGGPVGLTMTEPLDSIIVADGRVTHEVSPIESTGPDGHRDTLLVDLNPADGDDTA